MLHSHSTLSVYERPLRIITLATTTLATPLLIATTVVSFAVHRYSWSYDRRSVTAFCFGFIPLALTVLAAAKSLMHQRKHGRVPTGGFMLVDGITALVYLGVLIPVWAKEIGMLEKPSFGLLAGYTTAPMIVNMVVHSYIFACNRQAVRAWFAASQVQQCPNCHSNFTVHGSQVQETAKDEAKYSLLRGEDYLDVDADAEHYIDAATTFVDQQIRPDSESKGKTKEESKEEPNKTIIDV